MSDECFSYGVPRNKVPRLVNIRGVFILFFFFLQLHFSRESLACHDRFEELTDEAFPVYRAISRVIFHVKRFGVSNLIFTRSALFRFNLGAPIIIAEDVNLCESEREQF